MENLTIVIPFFNGHNYIHKLLRDLPLNIPVIIVDDLSDKPLSFDRENTVVLRLKSKGYFTGAVNAGIKLTRNDVLVLNQDIRLIGREWLTVIGQNRERYAYIGERIKGNHPAFPNGYIHGVFQFMRRDAIEKAGLMDEITYPLWGGSALWQWQICRKGFEALPLVTIPGLQHHHHNPQPGRQFGESITQLLNRELHNRHWFIRTPPMISVIVPCYNYGKYLPDCLNSLLGGPTSLGNHLGQTFQSFEVIIVDDGSTDNTRAIAQSYVNGWNGIKYIYKPNGGTPSALNTGIREAVGKYITTLSADDMREPWSLQDLYAASIKNPGKVIYDNVTEFINGKRTRVWDLPEYDFDKLITWNHMHSGIMYPKVAWEKVGGYSEVMIHGREDWQFNVALGLAGYCGKKIERSGYLYRREGHNRSLRNSGIEWREKFVEQMHRVFPKLYRGERPMSCCGGGMTTNMSEGTRAMTQQQLPAGEDMVLVEYTGDSVGTILWGGPGTVPSGTYYRFGKDPIHQTKYVHKIDVSWFLNYKEDLGDDQHITLFALKEEEKGSENPQTPPTELGGEVTVSGELNAILLKGSEPTQEPVLADAPVPDEEVVEDKEYVPDPSNMTIAEIKELSLSSEGWKTLLEMEVEGKSRLGVMDLAKSKMQ